MKATPGSPFHPTFGSTPPEFAGRQTVIDSIGGALDDGPGSAGRGALITGTRGIGKTVTLNAIEDMAIERGWVVISESVTKGLAARMLSERIPGVHALLAAPPGRKITGITLPASLGGVEFSDPTEVRDLGLRDALERLIILVEERSVGSGVLITLDEVHGKQGRSDLVQIAAEVQHLIRRNLNVALVAAGLPAAVQDLLNEDVTTFLRRAKRFRLGPLTRPEAEDALLVPIRTGGRDMTPDAFEAAVAATQGYPYLVQIIGDYAWKRTPADQDIIGSAEVEWAIRRAIYDMGDQVHGPALHDLSVKDREFLKAMSDDDGASRVSSVAERMGKDLNYSNQYRARLIAAEIIRPAGHGLVEFTLPYLAHYLRRLDTGF